MEKWVFTLLILFAIHFESICQVSFYATTGRNFSWINQDRNNRDNSSLVPDDELKYRPYHAHVFGFQLTHNANNRVNVGFELQYSQNGTREADDRVEVNYNYIRYIQSLEVETLQAIRLGAGVYWGYLISRRQKSQPDYFRDLREEWDYGVLISTSTKYRRFYFRLSYFQSLSTIERRILKGFSGSNPQFLYYRNKSIQLMLGYDLIGPKKDEEKEIESILIEE